MAAKRLARALPLCLPWWPAFSGVSRRTTQEAIYRAMLGVSVGNILFDERQIAAQHGNIFMP